MYFIVDLVHGAVDLHYKAAGIIADLVFTKNAAVNFSRKWCKRRKLFKIYIQTICLIVCIFMTTVGFDPGGCLKKLADPEEFRCA